MVTVDVVLFEGVDELDFCGPYEVLASCRKVVDGKWSDRPAFHVQSVAEYRSMIQCAHGMGIVPDKTFANAPEADIVIVPGGPGARNEHLPTRMIEFLRRAYETSDIVSSVCTGAFILGRAGLLDGHRVTTHHCRTKDLQAMYPKAQVVTGQRVVADGKKRHIITSGGITCGIDLALALIAHYEGKEAATLAADRLEWPRFHSVSAPASTPSATPERAGVK
ncbi:AraC family transcriptional regulator [Capsulimonas corticalis]|uniref:AraC family transcriptional regulator n=1 Tax=Capsulimonas corticalis TaxID=2219043 RepID=A0A402CTA8_9BACT|nr:DJ-1/PfpI family protein [Capsulimonas corticalis]BDI30801.1 AraC family transcriptional regulator [Capsulimonas corticalis]